MKFIVKTLKKFDNNKILNLFIASLQIIYQTIINNNSNNNNKNQESF